EAERERANRQVADKNMTIEEQNVRLVKEKADALRSATEAIAQKQNAERAMADAKRIAEKLEIARKELEGKLAIEKKMREDAERRAKGLSKELK
ncbi:MAG: hypothetical protein JHC98_12705, partial [Thermoleophilaceae bacterium]|nr:hypothetical protein [Thermoleophilaceae bacterium]